MSIYNGFMEKYPILFQDKNKPCTETCMCWGIECPDGWLELLTKLCDKLEFLNNTIGKEIGFKIVANQVKTKYATLRFYFSIYPYLPEDGKEDERNLIMDIVEDIVNMAELRSGEICSVCGKQFVTEADRIASSGWIDFYCKECANKKGILSHSK